MGYTVCLHVETFFERPIKAGGAVLNVKHKHVDRGHMQWYRIGFSWHSSMACRNYAKKCKYRTSTFIADQLFCGHSVVNYLHTSTGNVLISVRLLLVKTCILASMFVWPFVCLIVYVDGRSPRITHGHFGIILHHLWHKDASWVGTEPCWFSNRSNKHSCQNVNFGKSAPLRVRFHLSFCLSICLSLCLSVSLSVCLPVNNTTGKRMNGFSKKNSE